MRAFQKTIKLIALLALGLGFIAPVADVSAWGPERETYTNASPADHVQFNSITDNTAIGDERDFVRVSEDNGDGKYVWTNELKIEPGKKYAVMIYYHNNAASNLNSGDAVGLARGARVRSKFPATVNSSARGEIYAEISADNASPATVWDEAYLTTDSTADVVLHYVEGSATLYNEGKANGTVIGSDYLFTEVGQPLGYNQLLGNLPGCAEYSGQIIYSFYTTQVGATIKKTASLDGVEFKDDIVAGPGDTITYRIEFTNFGTADLTNVVFRDKLPDGVTLIEGTTKLINAANPDGVIMEDIIDENGFSTGTYGPGATAVLTYQAKINDDAINEGDCKTYEFVNLAIATHSEGEVSDDTTIFVNRDDEVCEELPDEIVSTGPLEITLAIIIVLGIGGGFYYLYRTRKTLKHVEEKVAGKPEEEIKPEDKSGEQK